MKKTTGIWGKSYNARYGHDASHRTRQTRALFNPKRKQTARSKFFKRIFG